MRLVRFSLFALTLFALTGCTAATVADGTMEADRAKHPYLSPHIFHPDQNDYLIDFDTLRQDMREYVESAQHPLGVYFEYLPSGISIGVHHENRFIAASLLKLPLAIEAFKMHRAGKLDFESQMTIEEKDLDRRSGTLWKRGAGTIISVGDVVRTMLIESDNTARSVLLRALMAVKPGSLDDAFDDLDLPKEVLNNELVVSPKNYTSVFISLYLASALHKEDAQQILTYLTQTPFTDMIVAGVPSHIPVAHKVGSYYLDDAHATFSDCGIVYAPQRPYSLCIMTQAPEEAAKQYMRELSTMAYDYVAHAKASQP